MWNFAPGKKKTIHSHSILVLSNKDLNHYIAQKMLHQKPIDKTLKKFHGF